MAQGVGGCQIASFIFFLIGYGTFLAAFGSNYWMDNDDGHWGLWRMCTSYGCTKIVGTDLMTGPFVGAQALMCVALITGAVSLGSHLAWLATAGPKACVVAWASGVSSGFCITIGLICFGSESIRSYGANVLSWSFWVALASCVMTVLNSSITACTTGCGSDLDDIPSHIAYSSRNPYPGAAPAPTQFAYDGPHGHDTSVEQEYSDINNSDYSMGNMNPQARPGPPLPRGHPGHPANIRY